MFGGGSRAAIWRPISARRALRCLEMNFRPQQLRERTRRLAGRSRMVELGGCGVLVADSIVMGLGGVVKYQCGGEEEGIEVDVFRKKLVLRSASSSLGKNKGLLVAALSANHFY